MKSYGLQVAEQFVKGEVPLAALFDWADAFGKSKYDPRDTESLYLAALVLNLRHAGASEPEVKREIAALIEPTGGGI